MRSEQDVVSDTIAAITARLAARHDGMTVLRAVTDACARFVELLQAQRREGPCLDCVNGNVEVTATDLDAETDRWPRFAPAAVEAGFGSVYA